MQILKQGAVAAEAAAETIKNGGLVIYPTETVYGIAADATNQKAVDKLTKYKNRPFGKPYSVAVTDKFMAEKYVFLNKTAKSLYKKFLPGPLTVVSKGRHKLANGIESEEGTLGIRIPKHPLVAEIVKKVGRPITSTSANASYKKRPYQINDILENITSKQKALIDLIIDAGKLPSNEPSTVIDTTLDDPIVLRQGEIRLRKENKLLTKNEEGTENFAKEMWQKYQKYQGVKAIVFALIGEMGSGKTIFTKGLAKAMQIKELVKSPTYVLENEYKTNNVKLFHFDAWRLTKQEELKDLGFPELIKSKSVVSLEWADRVSDTVREYDDEAVVVWIKIKHGKRQNDRFITWGNL